MKILALGDTHGRRTWEQILELNPDADKIIFMGDYFDTFAKIPSIAQVENFMDIMELRATQPERVVMLMGNHEFHYIMPDERYSGYQAAGAADIGEAVRIAVAKDLIQQAYQSGVFLFTHAGVTTTWWKENGCDFSSVNPDRTINSLFKRNPQAFAFNRLDKSGCGDSIYQGPFWVRPDSLELDSLSGFRHVVGHTQMGNIVIKDKAIYTDAIGQREYLSIVDGVPQVEIVA